MLKVRDDSPIRIPKELALNRCFSCPLGSINETPSSSTLPQKPAPEFSQFYGILVKLPRGPNVAPAFASPFLARDMPDRRLPRASKEEALVIPSALRSWDAESQFSFLLVEKTIWDDRTLTLRGKLSTGTYWNMSTQGRGSPYKEMDRTEVGQISGLDVIGLGDGAYDALERCRQCKCLDGKPYAGVLQ